MRTVLAWNATIARAGDGRKGLKRAKSSTRRANGGQEPGVAKAIWCRGKPGKRFCCCSHLWAQNVSQTFQRGEGILQRRRQLASQPSSFSLKPKLALTLTQVRDQQNNRGLGLACNSDLIFWVFSPELDLEQRKTGSWERSRLTACAWMRPPPSCLDKGRLPAVFLAALPLSA